MEYIEFDIKQEIYDALKGQIIPYSVELDCEIPGCTLNRRYDSNVYYSDEIDDKIEVIADFTCKVGKASANGKVEEITTKGSFKGIYNVEIKSFLSNRCNILIHNTI